jgi:hypothetical protein
MHHRDLAASIAPAGMLAGSHSMSCASLDGLGDGGLELLAPAADLALEVVAGLAVVGQPGRATSTWCKAAMTRFISS